MKSSGKYRNNPAEQLETCNLCHKMFHHLGIGPHRKACKRRRGKYSAKSEGYAWSPKGHKRKTTLPVVVQPMVMERPKHNESRVGISVSVDMNALQNLLKSLRLES